MALSLLDKAKQYFTSKSQDNEGWIRQGKFAPAKNLSNMLNDSSGWFQQGKLNIGGGIKQTQQRAAQTPLRTVGPLVLPNWQTPTGQDMYKSFGKGLVNTSTFGLVQPKYEPQSLAGKYSNIVGNVAGFVNPIGPGSLAMRGIENVGSKAIAKYAPQLTKSIGGKIVGGLGKELAQTAAYTVGQVASNKLGLAPNNPVTGEGFLKNLAYGAAFRGVLSPQGTKAISSGVSDLFGGNPYVSDITKVNNARQFLRTNVNKVKDIEIDKIRALEQQAEEYRKIYKMDTTKGWNKLSLNKKYDLISDKLEGLVRDGVQPIMGIVDKSQPIKTGGNDYSEVLKKDYDAAKKEFVMLTGEEPRNIRDLTEFKVNKKIPEGYSPNPKTWWGNKEIEPIKTGEIDIPKISSSLYNRRLNIENKIKSLESKLEYEQQQPGSFITGRSGLNKSLYNKQASSLDKTIEISKKIESLRSDLRNVDLSIKREQLSNPLKIKTPTIVNNIDDIKISESDSLILEEMGFIGDKKNQLNQYIDYLNQGNNINPNLNRINTQITQISPIKTGEIKQPQSTKGVGGVDTLPTDIPVYQEAKAVGMKRISPDRVLHQKLTPDEGISALVNQQKSRVERISNSWKLASEKIDNIIKKYGDNLPSRTSDNLIKYPELSKDYSEIYNYRKYAPGAKTLTQIRDTFKNRSEMSSFKWTPEAEKRAFESAKKDYIELVKKDISHGYRYPDAVLNYDSSFRKAIDSRARYEKGLYTSFSADDHRIVFDDTGNIVAGMKRQDGKELLPVQKREIVNGVLQTQNALGVDLNQMSKDDRWVYAHLNGKNPFLTQHAAGLYRPGDKSVSISLGGTEIFKTLENGKEVTKRINTTIAHELGHALDYKVKNNLIDPSTLFDLKRSYNPVEWGFRGEKYWRSSTEVTARALEEYVAVKEGNINLFDRDGYWNKEIFESKIKPAIEGAIDKHFPQYKTTLIKPLLDTPLSPSKVEIKQPTIKIKGQSTENKLLPQPELSRKTQNKPELPQSTQKPVVSSEDIIPRELTDELSGAMGDPRSIFKSTGATLTKKQFETKKVATLKLQSEGARKAQNEADAYFKSISTPAYKKGGVNLGDQLPADELLRAKKDKMAFAYQRETIQRNIEDIFGRDSKMKKYVVDNITNNENQSTNFQNTLRTKLATVFNNSGIKKGSKEDYAAADFIEGTLSTDQLKKQFPNKWQGIVKASEEGRAVYKDLLGKINTTLKRFGYEPIPERQNYVTHTNQIQTLSERIGSLTNLSSDELPRAMAGINLTTKPGRKFFSFGLQRQGGSTHEGLITALDKYIPSASRQIFHTEDIQRGRAILNFLQKSANEGDTRLSGFTSYFSQFVDHLAGKQNIIDRPLEKIFGRKLLSSMDWVRKRTGANMVGANLSSAATNFIPFTQSAATTSKPAFAKGLLESATNVGKEPSIIDGVQSGFLLRRFAKEKITGTLGENIKDIATLPFKLVDKFTSTSVVAGKYFEQLAKGLSKEKAMAMADDYAQRVMADRSFAQSPLLFSSKTLGALTQFQLEVNNQMSFLMKDIPKNLGYSKTQIASSLIQFAVYSYLFNNLYEKVIGRRPQIDPIQAGLSTAEGLSNGEGLQALNPMNQQGAGFSDRTGTGQILNQLPFTSVGGGRIPITTAITNPQYYLLPPFGGGQLKKTIEGLGTYNKGYSETKTGRVRFPIEKNATNLIKSGLFGQYSTKEARDYFGKNNSILGEKQSELMKQSNDKLGLYKNILSDRETNASLNKLKEEVKKTGNSGTTGDKYIYYKDGEVKTIDLIFNDSAPELTGNTELDKKKISTYSSGITRRINDIVELNEQGQMEDSKAEAEILRLLQLQKDVKKKTSSGKKSTKSKGGKITIAKVATPTIKKFKLPTIKLPNTSLKSNIKIKKPSIAQLKKRRTIKIKV